jgi:beta-aspartyl-peptidase (threonine type)
MAMTESVATARERRAPAIVVHGGAGAAPERADAFRPGMLAAVAAGWRVLADGGRALDAVEAAVRLLEDDPTFNAGRGSVLTDAGTVEMDASIMEGDRLACGAVAVVRRTANPITLARRILDDGRHVLLAGDGAEAFARAVGIPACDPGSLVVERRRRELAAGAAPSANGTVGAAALDVHGTLAAATSTGGMSGKRVGRVGDSALIGCGTYADSRLGAVSCTGAGEAMIRTVLARRTVDFLAEMDAAAAAEAAVKLVVQEGRGEGGLIVVDAHGRIAHATSTALMPAAWMSGTQPAPALNF